MDLPGSFITCPTFANSGTRIQPDGTHTANGFVVNEYLPAEYFNWLEWAVTANLNQLITNTMTELDGVLTQAGVSPVSGTNTQFASCFTTTATAYKYVQRDLNGNAQFNSIYVNSTTLVANLNADMLDGTHRGVLSKTIQYSSKHPGLLIPLYIYPTGGGIEASYASIIATARSYPEASIYVILNPSNGPGAVVDGNFTDAINKLKAAGIIVLGYVSTDYPYTAGHGTVTVDAAKATINTWLSFYPTIDGIFLDEMSYSNPISSQIQTYYKTLFDYGHSLDLFPIITNPGVSVPDSYYSTQIADVIVVYEGSSWPTESSLRDYSYNTDYPLTERAVLVYGSGVWNKDSFNMVKKYVGMLFCNDDPGAVLPNPWDVLSGYSNLEAALVPQSFLDGMTTGQTGVSYIPYVDVNGRMGLNRIPTIDTFEVNGGLTSWNGAIRGATIVTDAVGIAYMGSMYNNALVLLRNGAEKARIDTNDYFLLGYTTSQGAYKLQVNGGAILSGNVGIGTVNPQSIFEVAGTGTGASGNLRVGVASNHLQYISIDHYSAYSILNAVNLQNNIYGGYSFNSTNNAGTVTRMTIDNSGKIGIGRTPTLYQMEVNGIITSHNSVGTAGSFMQTDPSGNALFGCTGNNGIFLLRNGVEKARIDTNDYFLIGYTASQGAYKLQVNGDIYSAGALRPTLSVISSSGSIVWNSVDTQLNIYNSITSHLSPDGVLRIAGGSWGGTSHIYAISWDGTTISFYHYDATNLEGTINTITASASSMGTAGAIVF